MLDDKLQSRKDLLEEQLESVENSGFYTDHQIQVLSKPLRYELSLINDSLSFEFLTLQELRQLQRKIQNAIVTKHHSGTGFIINFSNVFLSLKKETNNFFFPKPYMTNEEVYRRGFNNSNLKINVIDAQVLTPNHQEA
ncbi:hypothetical protein [Flavobacterium granuli]|uniref:Uncharacterized protein n=1 Tax=Flavobacterium granuli TaxID=280093 RepID=A0ABU1S0B9_9FLAO|nr:hypothetical protein [Flavobacterium granuli]MDR6844476.1 hypothetical protein [Flavobacterium granuli]